MPLLKDMEPIVKKFYDGVAEGKYYGRKCKECGAIEFPPHLGCNTCGNAGPCVRKDDYENAIKPAVKAADMVVFAMPVYFYNWPASLKVCVDRFYSFMVELKEMRKKAVFIGAAWDDSDEVFAIPKAFYEKVCSYLQFSDQGMVLGRGCGTPDMTRATVYPQQAYELGKSL